jgi:hypothetical protein
MSLFIYLFIFPIYFILFYFIIMHRFLSISHLVEPKGEDTDADFASLPQNVRTFVNESKHDRRESAKRKGLGIQSRQRERNLVVGQASQNDQLDGGAYGSTTTNSNNNCNVAKVTIQQPIEEKKVVYHAMGEKEDLERYALLLQLFLCFVVILFYLKGLLFLFLCFVFLLTFSAAPMKLDRKSKAFPAKLSAMGRSVKTDEKPGTNSSRCVSIHSTVRSLPVILFYLFS